MKTIDKLKRYYEEGDGEEVAEIVMMDAIDGINDAFVAFLATEEKEPGDWDWDDLREFTEMYLRENSSR